MKPCPCQKQKKASAGTHRPLFRKKTCKLGLSCSPQGGGWGFGVQGLGRKPELRTETEACDLLRAVADESGRAGSQRDTFLPGLKKGTLLQQGVTRVGRTYWQSSLGGHNAGFFFYYYYFCFSFNGQLCGIKRDQPAHFSPWIMCQKENHWALLPCDPWYHVTEIARAY